MWKIALTALLAVNAGGGAIAADHMYRVGDDSMHLYYRDLDIRTATGRAALLRRVERAATRLCRDRIGFHREECVSEAVRRTASQPEATAIASALVERGRSELAAR